MIQKLCRSCHEPFRAFSTLQSKCQNCVKGFKAPRKRLNPIGKQAKLNKADRDQWIADNPPDKNGYWKCYLNISANCYIFVNKRGLNVEHKESKTRRVDLRHDQKNLGAACGPCNELKGSRSAMEVLND